MVRTSDILLLLGGLKLLSSDTKKLSDTIKERNRVEESNYKTQKTTIFMVVFYYLASIINFYFLPFWFLKGSTSIITLRSSGLLDKIFTFTVCFKIL